MNTTKRIYESMYIIDANLTDEQVDAIIAKYTKLIADQGGEVRAVGRWDKRRLAYEIMGRREGLYILMFFEAEPAVSKELDRVYRISDDVFRHLITRVELQHVDTSRIEHPQAVAEAAPVSAPAEEEVEVNPEAVEAEAEVAPEAATETVEEVTEEVEAPAAETASEEVVEEAAAEEAPVETESEEPKAEAEVEATPEAE